MGDFSVCSDLDEDLPVYDFLKPMQSVTQSPQSHAEGANIHANGTGKAKSSACPRKVQVIISSDSDDDEPYVPLAQRLTKGISAPVARSTASDDHMTESNLPDVCQPLRLPQTMTRVKEASVAPPQDRLAVEVQSRPTKRTAEEIQASREEPVKRKQAGIAHRRDKEALKLENEAKKAERKAQMEAAKALRPEECIKHMVVAVDPALLQLEGGGALLASVQALGCSCAIEKQTLPRSISWMRRAPGAQTLDSVCLPEAHVVMHITVEDFISLIHSYVQEERHGRSECSPTLTSWVQAHQRRQPDKILSLVVVDLEKYFRHRKGQSQKRLREAVIGDEPGAAKKGAKKKKKPDAVEALPEVSRVDIEEAMVHLQMHTDVCVRFLSSWKDFTEHIAMTTKAVAEGPFKLEREKTGFTFHLDSEWAGGHRVDKSGKGLLQVWKRQIQQLNRVSPDMASAILAAHPSPQLLAKAYKLCRTDAEKISLLADLLIRRGEGVTSTTRRVGPELSKRLFLLMNSLDPEQNLDSTV
ncbi:crossover junction endonuclease EME1 [Neosynchiropus ocellatus]